MSEGKVMQTGTTGEQAKTKVGVQGVPETMLQTLFARAAESEKRITISMIRKRSRSYPGWIMIFQRQNPIS